MEELKEFLLYRINWGAIFPVITFALGLSYSLIDKTLERRQTVKNIKTVLFDEIFYNFYIVATIANPTDESGKRLGYLSMMIGRLLTSVYDSYLDRLHLLKANELNTVTNAYRTLSLLMFLGKDSGGFFEWGGDYVDTIESLSEEDKIELMKKIRDHTGYSEIEIILDYARQAEKTLGKAIALLGTQEIMDEFRKES